MKGKEKNPLIVTTYLDNDDILHRDYIKKVQEYAQQVHCVSVVSFHHGIQYFKDYEFSVMINRRENHFLTMIEKPVGGVNPITAIGIGHAHLAEYKWLNVIDDTDAEGMWVEIVHSNNVENDVSLRRLSVYSKMDGSLKMYGCYLENKGFLKFLICFVQLYVKHACHRLVLKMKGQSFIPYLTSCK